MTTAWDPIHRAFLEGHRMCVLATGRRDGSPQQSMVAYAVDDEGRLLVSAKAYTAKWRNCLRQPRVSVVVPDGRTHLVIYGTAETIAADPARAELTAAIYRSLSPDPVPEASALVPMLDEQRRTVLRITADKTLLHE